MATFALVHGGYHGAWCNASERLDADILELPGAHSPFLSRPSVLADVLLRIADDENEYPTTQGLAATAA
jgi:hypothetical protein